MEPREFFTPLARASCFVDPAMALSAFIRLLLHLTALPLAAFSSLLPPSITDIPIHDSLPLITVQSSASPRPSHSYVFASSKLSSLPQPLPDLPSFHDTDDIQSLSFSITEKPSGDCFECAGVMLGDADEEKFPLDDGAMDEQFSDCLECAVILAGGVDEELSPLQGSTESTTAASQALESSAASFKDTISLQETELVKEASEAVSLGAIIEQFSACLKCVGIDLDEEKSTLHDSTEFIADASRNFEAFSASLKAWSSLEETELLIAEASKDSPLSAMDEKLIACLECVRIVSIDKDGEKSTLQGSEELGANASKIFEASAASFKDRIFHQESESMEERSEPSSLGATNELFSACLKCESVIPGIISREVEEEKSAVQDTAGSMTEASQTSEASPASLQGNTKSMADTSHTSEIFPVFINGKIFLQEAELTDDAWEVSSLGSMDEQSSTCLRCEDIILGEVEEENSRFQDNTELIPGAAKIFEAFDASSESKEQFGAYSKKDITFREVESIADASESSASGETDQQSNHCFKCAGTLLGEDEDKTQGCLQEKLESNGYRPQAGRFEETAGGIQDDSYNWLDIEVAAERDDRMQEQGRDGGIAGQAGEIMIMDGGWERTRNARKLLA